MKSLQVNTSSKQIISIALPISLSLLVPQLNFLINSIFLGHLSTNENALGNAGITGVYYLIFAVVGNGLNNSLQAVLSKLAGGKQTDKFATVFAQALLLGGMLAIIAVSFSWVVTPQIFKHVVDPQFYSDEISFLKIRILGIPFLYFFQLLNAFLIATLNSKLIIIGFVVEALVNILFDYLLIFGNAGFPQLGFNGAAWASVISEISAAVTVFSVVIGSGLKQRFKLFSTYRFNAFYFNKVRNMAFPLIIQYVISLSTWLAFFILLEDKGSVARNVSNVMRNIFGLVGVSTWAFAATANTMTANLMGQGKQQLIIQLINKISLFSFSVALVLLLILNINASYFFGFIATNCEFIQTATSVLPIVSVAVLIMSLGSVWLNSIVGLGKTKINLAIELVAIAFYIIYTFYFMQINYINLSVAWSNEIVYWAITLIVACSYVRSKKWFKE